MDPSAKKESSSRCFDGIPIHMLIIGVPIVEKCTRGMAKIINIKY